LKSQPLGEVLPDWSTGGLVNTVISYSILLQKGNDFGEELKEE
jgi:hypothetical protein